MEKKVRNHGRAKLVLEGHTRSLRYESDLRPLAYSRLVRWRLARVIRAALPLGPLGDGTDDQGGTGASLPIRRSSMFVRFLLASGSAAFLLTSSMTSPADACLFVGIHPITKQTTSHIHSRAFGITDKGACRRAERTCLRKLKHEWKNTSVQQFACKRID